MSNDNEIVVGIDLGTTNSEIAFYRQGNIEVVALDGEQIMPSVVGISPTGELLIGTAAKNQAAVFPEKTISSIKRRMGSDDRIQLGDKSYKPQEISSMILRELKRRAELSLGHAVSKAIITVPAFFSDAQRQATHDAGEIAGFQVLRILNEPTAASLAYESDKTKTRLVLVYDLGGGTFDVSIVEAHGEVTEVLASHGDTRLGGDDFDRLLLNEVIEEFIRQGNPDPRENRLAMGRLMRAMVQAKHDLSVSPYTRIREEHLLEKNGIPVHLDQEVSRQRYEDLIKPLVERTFESVAKALEDAKKRAADLDAVLLVGGMTRTPVIERRLSEVLGKHPRRDVHPDLAVAIGAGVLASRLGGHDDGRVLVDITPYSFGPESAMMTDYGFPIPDVYAPIIEKGSPLPVKETHEFTTMCDNQTKWDVKIYQGEDPVASRNIKIGNFMAEGFAKVPAGNKILCTLELNLDGILHVTVVEKATGLSKRVKIENALGAMVKEEMNKARENLDAFFGKPVPHGILAEDGDDAVFDADADESDIKDAKESDIEDAAILEVSGNSGNDHLVKRAQDLLKKAEQRISGMSGKDLADTERLTLHIRACLEKREFGDLSDTLSELEDIFYFVEEA